MNGRPSQISNLRSRRGPGRLGVGAGGQRPGPFVWLCSLGLVALALGGALLSGVLLRAHDPSPWQTAGQSLSVLTQLCGEPADCAAAARSAWSELSLPRPMHVGAGQWDLYWTAVPVALLGVAYFAMLATWFALGGWPAWWPRRVRTGLAVFVAAGGAFSVTYAVAMLSGAAPRCTTCLLTHGISATLTVFVLIAVRQTRPRRRRNSWQAMPAIAVAAVIVFGVSLYYDALTDYRHEVRRLLAYRHFVDDLQADGGFLLREFDALPVEPNALLETNADRPHLIVFTARDCPACRCFWPKLRETILPPFDGNVAVALRHVADEDEAMTTRAVYAAREQGGVDALWQMHAELLTKPHAPGRPGYAEAADAIGLDPDRLLADMDSDRVREAVAADLALAERLEVRATPTVFVNGRRLPPLLQTPAFWQALAARYAGQQPDAVARSTP